MAADLDELVEARARLHEGRPERSGSTVPGIAMSSERPLRVGGAGDDLAAERREGFAARSRQRSNWAA